MFLDIEVHLENIEHLVQLFDFLINLKNRFNLFLISNFDLLDKFKLSKHLFPGKTRSSFNNSAF